MLARTAGMIEQGLVNVRALGPAEPTNLRNSCEREMSSLIHNISLDQFLERPALVLKRG